MRVRPYTSSSSASVVRATATAALLFLFLFLTSPVTTVVAQEAPQGLYALSADNIDGVPTPLGEHHGKVALIVNLASK